MRSANLPFSHSTGLWQNSSGRLDSWEASPISSSFWDRRAIPGRFDSWWTLANPIFWFSPHSPNPALGYRKPILVNGGASQWHQFFPTTPLLHPQRLLSKEDPGSAGGEERVPHPLASLTPDPKHRDSALERVGVSLETSNRMPLSRGFTFIASNCGDTYAPGHYWELWSNQLEIGGG